MKFDCCVKIKPYRCITSLSTVSKLKYFHERNSLFKAVDRLIEENLEAILILDVVGVSQLRLAHRRLYGLLRSCGQVSVLHKYQRPLLKKHVVEMCSTGRGNDSTVNKKILH